MSGYCFRLFFCIVLLGSAVAFGAIPSDRSKSSSSAVTGLNESIYPEVSRFDPSKRVITFCPDNTCDKFTAGASTSFVDLKTLSFLYLYFFSDYYVLQEWRSRVDVRSKVEEILKGAKDGCVRETARARAACLLVRAERLGQMKLAMTRFDENREVVTRTHLKSRMTAEEFVRAKQANN
ncbi:MAG: hypothetical protein ING75_03945 [Rhodocyclaceae bacterium]|nr:hypothetical protein [Rhodocyclaceae bacterium]